MSKREDYISDAFTLVEEDAGLGLQVWVDAERLVVLAFSGRRQKPDIYSRYLSRERFSNSINNYVHAIKERASRKKAKREAEKAKPHPLKPGDVLRSTWGYEQTNVDYYQVVATSGKRTVMIRELAQEREATGHDSGKCIPVPGKFIGEAIKRRCSADGAVRVCGHQIAFKIEPKEVLPGVKVFGADYYSTYA